MPTKSSNLMSCPVIKRIESLLCRTFPHLFPFLFFPFLCPLFFFNSWLSFLPYCPLLPSYSVLNNVLPLPYLALDLTLHLVPSTTLIMLLLLLLLCRILSTLVPLSRVLTLSLTLSLTHTLALSLTLVSLS